VNNLPAVKNQPKLEKVATNDALHEAARGDAITNLKYFWGLATPTTVLARFPP